MSIGYRIRTGVAISAGYLVGIACMVPVVGADAGIADRIATVKAALPGRLEDDRTTWCLWGLCTHGPRLYHAPREDGSVLVGWTDAESRGHVTVLGGDGAVEATFDFPEGLLRGLAAHDDGSFAVLLLDEGGSGIDDDVMRLSKRAAGGGEEWSVEVTGPKTVPNTSSRIAPGDSRLAYGGGVYGAYVSVHGISGRLSGHEGDAYTRVDDRGEKLSGGWEWGLSHSMSIVAGYHPGTDTIHTYGVSDCYPHKGLHTGRKTTVVAHDGNCGGLTSMELGQAAAIAGGGWLVVFAAEQRAGHAGKGIGVVCHHSGSADPIWLTDTDGGNERDPVLARVGGSLSSNRFLVGWRKVDESEFVLGIIDTTGSFVEQLETVSPSVGWGRRDDSFRTAPDGSVTWVEAGQDGESIRLHRFRDGASVLGRSAGKRFGRVRRGGSRAEVFDVRGRKVRTGTRDGVAFITITRGGTAGPAFESFFWPD